MRHIPFSLSEFVQLCLKCVPHMAAITINLSGNKQVQVCSDTSTIKFQYIETWHNKYGRGVGRPSPRLWTHSLFIMTGKLCGVSLSYLRKINCITRTWFYKNLWRKHWAPSSFSYSLGMQSIVILNGKHFSNLFFHRCWQHAVKIATRQPQTCK